MDLRPNPLPSLVEAQHMANNACEILDDLLRIDFSEIDDNDNNALIDCASKIKTAYRNYNRNLSILITLKVKQVCSYNVTELIEERSNRKTEVNDIITVLNSKMAEGDVISEVTNNTSLINRDILQYSYTNYSPSNQQFDLEFNPASSSTCEPIEPVAQYLRSNFNAMNIEETPQARSPLYDQQYVSEHLAQSTEFVQFKPIASSTPPTPRKEMNHDGWNLEDSSISSLYEFPRYTNPKKPLFKNSVMNLHATEHANLHDSPYHHSAPGLPTSPPSLRRCNTVGRRCIPPSAQSNQQQPDDRIKQIRSQPCVLPSSSIDPASLHLLKQNLMKKSDNPYCGEAHLFQTFMNQYNCAIKDLPLDPWDLICILEARTAGKPQKIIRSYMINCSSDPALALQNIYQELFERFGTGSKVANSLITKLESLPQVRSIYQVEKLEELLEICKIINTNIAIIEEFNQFNNSYGIRKVWDKLPDSFQNSWRTVNSDFKALHGGSSPSFQIFTQFLTRKIREFSDPTYEKTYSSSILYRKPRETQNYKIKSEREQSSESLEDDDHEQPALQRCSIHPNGQHQMKDCYKFINSNKQRRIEIMNFYKLCLRCLGKHSEENCHTKLECNICGNDHLEVFHKDSHHT